MNKKLYKYRNVGFTFNGGGKWSFTIQNKKVGTKILYTEAPGGHSTAEKIAIQVNASFRRSRQLRDGLANSAINRLTHPVSA